MWTATPGECGAKRRRNTPVVTSVLLVLHSPILKPNFHLLLGEAERGGDLDTSQTGKILAGGELVLETQQLRARKRCAQTFHRRTPATSATWRFAAVLCLCIRNC